MSTVTHLPLSHVREHELQIQAWELVMAGGFRSDEHRRIVGELDRRVSCSDKTGRGVN